MKLKIEYLDNYDREWGELSKAHSTDAGFDLRSTIESIIYPDGILFVPLGFKTSFEEGYEAQVRARSGLALKNGIGLVNGIGTIDAGYRGEWGAILVNHGDKPFHICRGDRVCQVVFNKLPQIDIEYGPVDDGNDRCGGFGSSGVA